MRSRRYPPLPTRRPEPTEAECTAAVVKWLGLQAEKHRKAARSLATQQDSQEAIDHAIRNAETIEACMTVLLQDPLLSPASIHHQVNQQGRGS